MHHLEHKGWRFSFCNDSTVAPQSVVSEFSERLSFPPPGMVFWRNFFCATREETSFSLLISCDQAVCSLVDSVEPQVSVYAGKQWKPLK